MMCVRQCSLCANANLSESASERAPMFGRMTDLVAPISPLRSSCQLRSREFALIASDVRALISPRALRREMWKTSQVFRGSVLSSTQRDALQVMRAGEQPA